MIDLHCHSTASDGSNSPEELLSLASEKKIRALALTDHDTTSGLPAFLEAAANTPDVEAIPGIELAAEDALPPNRGYHIVGLYIDHRNERLHTLLEKVLQWREERNLAMIERLVQQGIPITVEGIRAIAGNAVIGRPHIALKLIELGYAKDVQNAFDRYLATGKCGYVRRRVPTPQEVISAIHAAGGLAIWAHPFTHGNYTVTQMNRFAVALKNYGLDGLEAYYAMHTPHQVQNVLAMCSRYALLVSGGSDYHGTRFRNVELGTGIGGKLMVPDSLLAPLHEKLKQLNP